MATLGHSSYYLPSLFWSIPRFPFFIQLRNLVNFNTFVLMSSTYLDVSTALPGASSSQPSSATVSSQTTTPGYFLSFLAERTFKHFILRWLSMLWWRGLRAAWWRSATTSWAAPPPQIAPGITLLMRTDAQNCDEEYLFLRNFEEQKRCLLIVAINHEINTH